MPSEYSVGESDWHCTGRTLHSAILDTYPEEPSDVGSLLSYNLDIVMTWAVMRGSFRGGVGTARGWRLQVTLDLANRKATIDNNHKLFHKELVKAVNSTSPCDN